MVENKIESYLKLGIKPKPNFSLLLTFGRFLADFEAWRVIIVNSISDVEVYYFRKMAASSFERLVGRSRSPKEPGRHLKMKHYLLKMNITI